VNVGAGILVSPKLYSHLILLHGML
jgi:hypothetical protein